MENLRVTTSLGYYQDDYNFKENIKHLRGDTYYYYADWGNLAITGLEDLFDLSNNKKRKLIQFIKEYSNYYPEYSRYNNLENVIAEVFDMYTLESIKDFVYDLEKFGIEVTPKFERHVSRGYSQGDCIEVFIPHKVADIWGVSLENFIENICTLETDIDHWCWDSEISGQINISFSYEVKRESFGDSIIIEFIEEFEYQEWGTDNYEFELHIDGIIKCIDRKCMGNVGAESLEMIRKKLQAIDYNDIKY